MNANVSPATQMDPPPPEVTFLGARARILVSGEETGGAFSLVEMVDVPPRRMPPLHVHHAQDEGFYLIAGSGRFHLPGREITLRAGGFLLAPRGVPHTYRPGDEGARWLTTSTPAGFERFVVGVASLDEPGPDAIAAVAAEHGIEILGPPGALP